MADRVAPGPVSGKAEIGEAVSVDTRKIFDSCRDKDCIDDLRVYPTVTSQIYLDSALSLRPRSAELLYVDVKVSPINFNRGYYTIDCTYFYRITGEAFPSGDIVTGLGIFDKRVMLFGSVAGVKTFHSDDASPSIELDELPTAVVDSVDPIALRMKLADPGTNLPGEAEPREIPAFIMAAFDEDLVLTDTGRRWYATLGQFSLVRLERDTQLLIPAYDYNVPEKECPGSSEDDPCALFGRIRFPVEEFFPPDSVAESDEYRCLL
ncbi:MAG: hypothetical protein IJI27_08750 [Oscillospiraceae bacterium]|nr:hypothetical protein [Oscillospiraceae bacterium]